MARARGGDTSAAASTLTFMYAPPPGLEGPGESKVAISTVDVDPNDLTQRQPGDDDAAAAFRAMLAAASVGLSDTNPDNGPGQPQGLTFSNSRGAALQGSTVDANKKKAHMSALEKAVGKKTAQGLSLEEQIERFPQLKNAPMAKGMTETNVNVTFKPLGTQLRNVRCLACGVWGHSRNDRECLVSGWDPFSGGPLPEASTGSTLTSRSQEKVEDMEGKSAFQKEEKISLDEKDRNRSKSNKQKKRRYRSDSSSDDSSDSDSFSEEERRRRKRKKHKSKRTYKDSSRKREELSRSPGDRRGSKHERRRRYESDDS